MSGQPMTLNCGVPGPGSQMPCLRQACCQAGQVHRDRLPDAAGRCAKTACGNGPDGLAGVQAEGGKRVLDGRGG
jgi:hypothetical protein